MRRKGFARHRRTSICQKLPMVHEEKLYLQRYMIRLQYQHGYMTGKISNADETLVGLV